MAPTARFRAPAILLTLVLVASPVLAAGQPATRTPRDPGSPGVFASLWNALHGLFLAVGESDSGTGPQAPANAATPPPPPADPDRGIMIDPWG